MLDRLLELAGRPFLNNPAWAWAAALGASFAVLFGLIVLRRIVARRVQAQAPGGVGRFVAELVRKASLFLLLAAALWVGSLFVVFPAAAGGALRALLIVLALLQAGLWANALLSLWVQAKLQEPAATRSTAVVILGFGGRLAVWTVVLLLALDNVGIDITALIAGLGVGGIAVALAVQNILGDLFASVAIAFDKPFEIGDFIIVGDMMGAVEYIGLKTTRVRSLWGEQIVLPNADLLGSRIRNFKRMQERRVVFSLGITYETPVEKIAAVPAMIREIVQAQPDLRFDRAHFQKYGDSALLFEVVYNVLSPDYNLYMDRQQAINLEILRRFAREGIAFAYPTQTLFLQRAPQNGAADVRHDRTAAHSS
ncbi:MAG TPA: mechanosensitive ion channel family protein [Planctomycetota bacterium]|nr:mechanosensitive ion channel family protein [Planctomycetota bacterium]